MTTPIEPEHQASPNDDGRFAGEMWFGWTSHPKAKAFVFIGMIALVAILFLADFVVHRHEYFDLPKFPLFYGLFGFGAFALVVLSGWPLRKLLARPENYYEPEEDDDA